MSKRIEFGTALLARQAGYPVLVDCHSFDTEVGTLVQHCGEFLAVPTQEELAKWLREKHGQYVLVTPYYDSETETVQFEGQCGELDTGMEEIYYSDDHVWYDEWEYAMEAALRIGLHAIDFTNLEDA